MSSKRTAGTDERFQAELAAQRAAREQMQDDMDIDEDAGDIGELLAKRRKLPDFFYHKRFTDVLDNSVFDEGGQ